ncbi:hypothetical protein Hanom_Chr04g00335341 [Helianthus anomalus]
MVLTIIKTEHVTVPLIIFGFQNPVGRRLHVLLNGQTRSYRLRLSIFHRRLHNRKRRCITLININAITTLAVLIFSIILLEQTTKHKWALQINNKVRYFML